MTPREFNNCIPGDRLLIEVDGRERIFRVTHLERGLLCGNVHRFNAPGWCSGTIKVRCHHIVEKTYDAKTGEQTIANALIGGAA